MPTVKIPVTRFKECQMGASEREFVHAFGEKLRLRGFRFGAGRWVRDGEGVLRPVADPTGPHVVPDPPFAYQRGDTELTVSQDVPGRVSDRQLAHYLGMVRAGRPGSVESLQGILLAEGDDRAATLSSLHVDLPKGEGYLLDDFGTPTDSVGGNLVTADVVAERLLREKVLILFGEKEAPL